MVVICMWNNDRVTNETPRTLWLRMSREYKSKLLWHSADFIAQIYSCDKNPQNKQNTNAHGSGIEAFKHYIFCCTMRAQGSYTWSADFLVIPWWNKFFREKEKFSHAQSRVEKKFRPKRFGIFSQKKFSVFFTRDDKFLFDRTSSDLIILWQYLKSIRPGWRYKIASL